MHAVRSRTLALTIATLAILPASSLAQELPFDHHRNPPRPIAAYRDRSEVIFGTLAVNAAIGATTAVLGRMIERRDQPGGTLRAAAWGAAGGAVGFAGKMIASSEASHGGLAGRTVAAIGYSVVQGAAFGESPLEQVAVPFGPLRIYAVDARDGESAHTVGGRRIRVKLDAASTAAIIYEITSGDSRFDAGASLRSGAPVFRSRSAPEQSRYRAGAQFLGVVRLAPEPWIDENVLRHELVHVLQYDQRYIGFGSRLDRAVLARIGGGERVDRWIDFGFVELLWGAATSGVPYDRRPWEREAHLLTERAPVYARR